MQEKKDGPSLPKSHFQKFRLNYLLEGTPLKGRMLIIIPAVRLFRIITVTVRVTTTRLARTIRVVRTTKMTGTARVTGITQMTGATGVTSTTKAMRWLISRVLQVSALFILVTLVISRVHRIQNTSTPYLVNIIS